MHVNMVLYNISSIFLSSLKYIELNIFAQYSQMGEFW